MGAMEAPLDLGRVAVGVGGAAGRINVHSFSLFSEGPV